MLNSVSIGRYFPLKSRVHEMHPLSKIICVFIFILMTLIVFDLKTTVVLILLTLFMIINTKIPFKIYYDILLNLKFILLFIFLFFSLVSLSFAFGFIVLIKFVLVIVYLAILTLTTPPTETVYGLERFLYPLNRFKIQSNVWALNIGLALRFIPTLIDNRNNVLSALAVRGVDYRSGFSNYLKAHVNMVRPAISLSLRQFRQLKSSMMIRFFSIDKERCNYRINKWGFFDNLMIILHSILLILILGGVIL